MSKGTPSMGKRQKSTHIRCRRCGRHSFHKTKSICSSCGYGQTAKLRKYRWSKRNRSMGSK
ncbi:MAG: 50S ribosomal protein L37e [Euryarchaeota archaeon]|nr:50S ribosomal protein L37e [Euryarchaeota archaeon]MBP50731.1 50S ribosomal protein L37e [Euryarchaeota archaeon]